MIVYTRDKHTRWQLADLEWKIVLVRVLALPVIAVIEANFSTFWNVLSLYCMQSSHNQAALAFPGMCHNHESPPIALLLLNRAFTRHMPNIGLSWPVLILAAFTMFIEKSSSHSLLLLSLSFSLVFALTFSIQTDHSHKSAMFANEWAHKTNKATSIENESTFVCYIECVKKIVNWSHLPSMTFQS